MSTAEKEAYKEQVKQREEEEKLQPLKPYIGTVLYDAANDRVIYCIGFGKASRTRTSYDKKTWKKVETTSDIPGMEVRYFPRPKPGEPARARKEKGLIGPGQFLANIAKGTYSLREDINLDATTEQFDQKLFPSKDE